MSITTRLLRVSILGAVGASLAACTIKSDDLEEKIDNAANNVEICDGMTFNELRKANGLSDGCRALLDSYLPKAEDNFESRLIPLGSYVDDDGSFVVVLHGVDADGDAMSASTLAAAEVSAPGIELGGSADVSTDASADGGIAIEAGVEISGGIRVTLATDITGDLLSIQFVNDYSASMRNGDLDTVATIHRDILDILPPIYEGEVTYFSKLITVKQAFTTDESKVRAALTRDNGVERDTTALYDGIGSGLTSLIERERPLKLMIVSTDGLENSSTEFDKAQIVSLLRENHVAVLMLGAVFSDIAEMRELAGPYGVFFYTPGYEDLRNSVRQYVESLSNMVALHLPPEYANADEIQISAGGQELTVDPTP